MLSCCSTASHPVAATSTACDATTVAEKVLPSVVTITSSSGSGGSTGSGEIIRQDGYVLTNNHVVAPATNGGSISVLLSDGATYAATIRGRDPETDLAVIKVPATALSVVVFGLSSAVRLGEPVVALGAPLGLAGTVTTGIVSALGRTIEVPADNGATATLLSALQTDAAINPGNSGGALTNCEGDLIGVPTANAVVTTSTGQTSAGNVGVSFAIPSDLAKYVADELIATGTLTHSYLGLTVTQIPTGAATQAGGTAGLRIEGVVTGGPAAVAGLQPGDVITEIDGKPATSSDQLALLTVTKKPGTMVTLGYERAGAPSQANLVLGTPPP